MRCTASRLFHLLRSSQLAGRPRPSSRLRKGITYRHSQHSAQHARALQQRRLASRQPAQVGMLCHRRVGGSCEGYPASLLGSA